MVKLLIHAMASSIWTRMALSSIAFSTQLTGQQQAKSVRAWTILEEDWDKVERGIVANNTCFQEEESHTWACLGGFDLHEDGRLMG